MRTFLNRNAFEKILISFSQPSSTRHTYLFSFSITHIYTFHIYTSHRLMNIDFFDCLMFFKSTRLFVFFKTFVNLSPLSQWRQYVSIFFFPIKTWKTFGYLFFRKLFLNVAIYTLNQYTHKIPEYFLSKKC